MSDLHKVAAIMALGGAMGMGRNEALFADDFSPAQRGLLIRLDDMQDRLETLRCINPRRQPARKRMSPKKRARRNIVKAQRKANVTRLRGAR